MNELKEYISTEKKDRIITFIFGLIFWGFGVVIRLKIRSGFSTVLMIAMFLCGILLLYFSFFAGIKQKKKIEELINSGLWSKALEDFSSAKPFASDTIRLGSEYIFRRKQTEIIDYSEITEISGYDRTGIDNAGSEYFISAKLQNKKTVWLCSVYGLGGSDEGQKIIDLINSKRI